MTFPETSGPEEVQRFIARVIYYRSWLAQVGLSDSSVPDPLRVEWEELPEGAKQKIRGYIANQEYEGLDEATIQKARSLGSSEESVSLSYREELEFWEQLVGPLDMERRFALAQRLDAKGLA